MVSRSKSPATAKRAPARKREAARIEPPAADIAKPNLLRAGLKALGNVRDDVVQHQSRVFEAILGIEPGQGWSGRVKKGELPAAKPAQSTNAAQEAFGLRKFEAIFDQRVASAMERMGMPSTDELRTLKDELAALRAEVAALKAARPKPAPRKR